MHFPQSFSTGLNESYGCRLHTFACHDGCLMKISDLLLEESTEHVGYYYDNNALELLRLSLAIFVGISKEARPFPT